MTPFSNEVFLGRDPEYPFRKPSLNVSGAWSVRDSSGEALHAGPPPGYANGMLLYFLRHAEAEDGAIDFDRRLTPKGLEQADKVAAFCRAFGLKPDGILTSPVVRARQTADIVAKSVKVPLEVADWLACGMTPQNFAAGMAGRRGEWMVVGHEPDFSDAIANLLGLPNAEGLKIRKASLTAVDAAVVSAGAGQLQFLVPARLMWR
ncbi:MAG: histidine phosphatase family protein [Terrimicrobiaceae bacterium]|nr:histidine phosphatase family protein [Terrimicrobiaceae bacterium]